MADAWKAGTASAPASDLDEDVVNHEADLRAYGSNGISIEAHSSTSTLRSEGLSIPPADHGKAAWLFLFGCFWVEGLVWGLPFSFGVFQNYYSHLEPFASELGIPAIGTAGMGLSYFLCPFIIITLQRWPLYRKPMSILGLVTMVVAMIGASFATHTIHLVFTQGVLYGIGASFLYNPFVFYLDEWFIERKGLAYGVFWAGTGICSSVLPFVMESALNTFGFRTTLRCWAALISVSLGCLIWLIRPRLPITTKGLIQGVHLGFFRSPLFWAFEVGNIIEGLGYFIPQIFLPSFAETIGLSQLAGTLTVSLLNISSTFGLVFMGALIDRYHVSNVLLLSAVTSTLSVFLLWGFATTEAMLYAFTICFGVFGGGYTGSWPGCSNEVKKQYPDAETTVIMGTLVAGRGFGCVICGPLSEWLLDLPTSNFAGIYGTRYGSLIIFTGVTSLLGRFGLFGRCGMRVGEKRPRDERETQNHDETSPLVE